MDLVYVYLVFNEIPPETLNYDYNVSIFDKIRIDVPDIKRATQLQTHIEEAIYETLVHLRFRKMHLQKMEETQSLEFNLNYFLDLIQPQVLYDFYSLSWKGQNPSERRQMLFMISEHIANHQPLEIKVYFAPHVINTEIMVNNMLGLLDSMVVELPQEIDRLAKSSNNTI